MCTAPCIMLVRPWAKVMLPIMKVSTNMTKSLVSKPSVSGKPNHTAVSATAGMVKPILAKAEPSARFKLVCKRLALAARKAARVSGIKTNKAMTMPTKVCGGRELLGQTHHDHQAHHQCQQAEVGGRPRRWLGVGVGILQIILG